jgi:choline dehydrogenase
MAAIGAQWFLTRKGVCSGNQLHAGAFIRSKADPEIDHPDIQFHFLPSQVIDHGRKNPEIEAYQVHVGTLRAKSVGNLKITVS